MGSRHTGHTIRATEARRHRGNRLEVTRDGVHAALTDQILKCAIEVHSHLGPGLLESIYESALCFELTAAGRRFRRQVAFGYWGYTITGHRVTEISRRAQSFEPGTRLSELSVYVRGYWTTSSLIEWPVSCASVARGS
jgi:hypothetical protein